MTEIVRALARRQRRSAGTRPARVSSRAAAPVLLELTTHYTVRGGRIFRDAIYRHADGSEWTHYLPEEAAA